MFNTIALTVSENYFYLPRSYLYTYIRLKYSEFLSRKPKGLLGTTGNSKGIESTVLIIC